MCHRIWSGVAGILGLAAFLSATPSHVQAQQHSHGSEEHGQASHGRDYHGRDFHQFGPEERAHWQGGRWIHDWHDGRFAWWWMLDGFWYFYPAPIYPYPTYVPPAIVVQQAPPVPRGLPPTQFWYYCDNPGGYYPYVASCSGPWRPVPAVPPPPPSR
jgi:hypothetical protein